MPLLPAQADPAKARKRPAVAGMKLTEPHAVPKAVDRGRGKVTLPVWTDPTKQVSVAEGTTVVDLKGPAKARGKERVLVKAAKNSSKGKTGKASKATVTTKAGRTTSGQPVALVSVKTDLPDTVTVNADPAVLGAGAGRAQLVRVEQL